MLDIIVCYFRHAWKEDSILTKANVKMYKRKRGRRSSRNGLQLQLRIDVSVGKSRTQG